MVDIFLSSRLHLSVRLGFSAVYSQSPNTSGSTLPPFPHQSDCWGANGRDWIPSWWSPAGARSFCLEYPGCFNISILARPSASRGEILSF